MDSKAVGDKKEPTGNSCIFLILCYKLMNDLIYCNV